MHALKYSNQTNSVEHSLDSKEGWLQKDRFLFDNTEPTGTIDEIDYFHLSQTMAIDDYRVECYKKIQDTINRFFSDITIKTNDITKKQDPEYLCSKVKESVLSDIDCLYEFLGENINKENPSSVQYHSKKRLFACQHCGIEGLHLKEVSLNEWMPFDAINNVVHQCLKDKYKGKPTLKELTEKERDGYRNVNVGDLSLDNVIQQLQHLGFQSYTPRTSSWKQALIASNETQTIYFLIGSKGIDFKFYDELRETKIDQKGKIFTDGIRPIVRNYYREANVNIHRLILDIASLLVTNNPIEESLMSGQGSSGLKRRF